MEKSVSFSKSNSSIFTPQGIQTTLENHAFFHFLDSSVILKLSNELVARFYNDKDYIIRQGEVGRAMFIVVKGVIEVVSQDAKRTASCRAKGRCLVLILTKQKFDEFLGNHPEAARVIGRIAEDRFKTYLAKQKKQELVPFGEEIGFGVTQNDLKNVPIFRNCEIGFLQMLALELKPKHYKQNELIVRKGDVASEMYFIVKGEAEVFNDDGLAEGLPRFTPGSFIGEIGLFFNVPRTVSVRCVTDDVVVFQLSKEDLNKTMKKFPEIEQKIHSEAEKRLKFNEMRKQANLSQKQELETEVEVIRERLKHVSFCRKLPIDFLHTLALNLKLVTVSAGEKIIKKGDSGSSMYFMVDGSAKVINQKNAVLAELSSPNFFGEVALFFDGVRTATVAAYTNCTLLELTKADLEEVIKTYPQLKNNVYAQAKENYQEFLRKMDQEEVQGYSVEVVKKKLEMVPIFQNIDLSFIGSLALQVSYKNFNQGEYIIRKGEIATAMYFISDGTVDIINEDNQDVLASVSAGNFFGEVGVLNGIKRTASVRVQTEACHLLVVTTEAIQKIGREHPEAFKLISLEAERRLSLAKSRENAIVSANESSKPLKLDASGKKINAESGVSIIQDEVSQSEIHVISDDSSSSILGRKKGAVSKFMSLIRKPFSKGKVAPGKESTSCTSLLNPSAEKNLAPRKEFKITDLDLEVFVEICSFMDIKTKFGLRLVCKKWNGMLTEKMAWRDLNFKGVAYSSHHKLITAFCGMVGTYLVNLNLSGCWRLLDEDIESISHYCPNIEMFNIANCWNITDKGLYWAKNLKNVTDLNFSYCSKVTGQTIDDHNWTCLSRLNLSYCKLVNHTILEKILSRAPNLQIFEFRRCNRTSDYAIFAIARHCKSLKHLDLSDCEQVNDACLKWIGTGCVALESLNLSFCHKVTPAGVQDLVGKAKKLQVLNLAFCFSLDDRVGSIIAKHEHIRLLSFRGSKKVSDGIMETLIPMKQLEVVNFTQCPNVTKEGAEYLSRMRNCRVILTEKLTHQ